MSEMTESVKQWFLDTFTITRRDLIVFIVGFSVCSALALSLYKWRINEFRDNHSMVVDGYTYSVEFDTGKNAMNETLKKIDLIRPSLDGNKFSDRGAKKK